MMKALLGLILLVPARACEEPLAAAPAFDDILVTVGGTVKFDGPPPPVKPNKAIAADPACSALHAQPPPQETLVVHPDGGVRWAFVWIKSGLPPKEYPIPKEGPFIDQKGCRYEPRVVGVQVGQPVNFRNFDPLLHNVHGLPFLNKEWNFGQLQGAVASVKLPLVETSPPITVKCNVHPWMSSYIFVLEHPYFAVTDEEGKFAIKNLPAGKYTLGVWHEGLNTKEGKNEIAIEIKADKTLEIVMVKK